MNAVNRPAPFRWDNYFMRSGSECGKFWKSYLHDGEKSLLLILGLGFDPRMCEGLRMLINAKADCVKQCLLIKYDEGPESPSHQYEELIKSNLENLSILMNGRGSINDIDVPMFSEDRRRIGSRLASGAIDKETIENFDDIIVDISAMPRGIYFPILAKLLYLLDEKKGPNLHVLVSEKVSLDEVIQEEGIDDHASYLYGFSSDLVLESTAAVPKVWIPVLGEGKEAQLIRLYDHVRPDEICAVMPSPSSNPRRVDDLVAEYREILFDRLRVEPTNFIYASERNPFEAYRQIYQTIDRYNHSLEALGKCKVVVSALSSKLLSVGALLAAYEAKRNGFMVGICHVETHGYKIDGQIDPTDAELFTLWIAGDCYDA